MIFPCVHLELRMKVFVRFACWLGILLGSSLLADVSVLGEKPDWSRLDKYRHTMNRQQFEKLLKQVFVPREAWRKGWIEITEDSVRIRRAAGKDEWYELPFAKPQLSAGNRPKEYWRYGDVMRSDSREKLLHGFRIALDPGHIGGKYSKMEGRHFEIGDAPPIKEGNQVLTVAKRLTKRLAKLGATVFLIRKNSKPVTLLRPKALRDEAKTWLGRRVGYDPSVQTKKESRQQIRRRSEILFFRTSEILERARKVNDQIKPDLVVCLHLNAAPWLDPEKPELVHENHYHVLTNGAYMGGEVALDNQRFEMLVKLLNRSHPEEQFLAECMAVSFARATGLPAFSYKGPNAVKVGGVPGVWGRNLMANRLYECPVVFLEPYVANSKETFARILAGDYKGAKKVGGKFRVSLIEEYVDAVVAGMVSYAAGHSR